MRTPKNDNETPGDDSPSVCSFAPLDQDFLIFQSTIPGNGEIFVGLRGCTGPDNHMVD